MYVRSRGIRGAACIFRTVRFWPHSGESICDRTRVYLCLTLFACRILPQSALRQVFRSEQWQVLGDAFDHLSNLSRSILMQTFSEVSTPSFHAWRQPYSSNAGPSCCIRGALSSARKRLVHLGPCNCETRRNPSPTATPHPLPLKLTNVSAAPRVRTA